MVAYARRDFAGAAVATTVASDINNSATTMTLSAATGWPDGTNGPFFVAINRGNSTEEIVSYTTRVGTSLSGGTRATNGTSAASHVAGEVVEHIITKTDADEANYTVAQTVGKVTTNQDLLVATGANAFARLAKGADDTVLGIASGTVAWRAQSTITHANLGGLSADDHTQYTKKATLSAKGSLYVASAASTPAELAVGSNNQFLVADSAQTTGAKWAAIPTGAISAAGMFAAGVVDATALATSAVTTAKINAAAVDETKLAASVAGNGLAGGAGTVLSVNVDNSTLAITADTLAIKAAGVTSTELAAGISRGSLASGYVAVTANQGSITTETDLTSLTVTVTVRAGSRIKITAKVEATSNVDGDAMQLHIKESTTVLNRAITVMANGVGDAETLMAVAVLTPSTGSHTYKLSLLRASGTGTLTMVAGATYPGFLLVEDLGA